MRIGNRHFPYPILNHNKDYSNYLDDYDFYLCFQKDESNAIIMDNGELILKDVHYYLNDPYLESLANDGKIGCSLIVECSASVFREKYAITKKPYDLHIPATNFNDRVEFSCYLYALEELDGFCSEGFEAFYAGYKFDIEKYDILAVDDGFKMRIDINPSQDDKVSSIFTIVKAKTEELTMKASYDREGITIALPTKAFEAYETIKTKKEFNNIAFSMIAIPALSDCLKDVQNTQFYSIEEIVDGVRWFRAICKSYYAKTKQELDYDTFESANTIELAQTVLNDASCNGIIDFSKLLTGHEGEDDE